MDDFATVLGIGARLDNNVKKGSMTKLQLTEALRHLSLSYELKMEPRKCTVIVNTQTGTSMYHANSGEELFWLTRQAERIYGAGAYTRYEISTVD